MGQNDRLTPEARITEIQEFLIDRYVEQNEALEKAITSVRKRLVWEIKELQPEKEKIKEWANV
jgi:hypothetical protein